MKRYGVRPSVCPSVRKLCCCDPANVPSKLRGRACDEETPRSSFQLPRGDWHDDRLMEIKPLDSGLWSGE